MIFTLKDCKRLRVFFQPDEMPVGPEFIRSQVIHYRHPNAFPGFPQVFQKPFVDFVHPPWPHEDKDYLDCLEVVYHFTSMVHNHSIVLKTRCTRENPEVDSLYSLFRGADYQEREIYDLLGVKFVGHPNLKRLFMWETFEGHPLRRDYL